MHQGTCKLSQDHDRIRASHLSRKQQEARLAEHKAITMAKSRQLAQREAVVPDPMEFDLPPFSPSDTPPFDPSIPTLPEIPVNPEPETLGRGQRVKRPTWKVLEHQAVPVQLTAPPQPVTPPPEDPLPIFQDRSTDVNRYGLYCKYLSSVPISSRTRFTPTPIHFIEPLTRVPLNLRHHNASDPSQPQNSTDYRKLNAVLAQCSNISSQLVMAWHWSSPTKSLESTNQLVHSVIRHVLMNPQELTDFDARLETKRLDAAIEQLQDGWRKSAVKILVPDGKPHPSSTHSSIPTFSVPGLMHRSVTAIIKAVWTSPESSGFQHVPYRQYWTRGRDGVEERVHGELYTSEVFNAAYEELQIQSPEPGCKLERIVCGIMLYSDSTHLASFGSAALWPLYMYFGNQSKYVRGCPSSGSCHHVAYIPKVGTIISVLV